MSIETCAQPSLYVQSYIHSAKPTAVPGAVGFTPCVLFLLRVLGPDLLLVLLLSLLLLCVLLHGKVFHCVVAGFQTARPLCW